MEERVLNLADHLSGLWKDSGWIRPVVAQTGDLAQAEQILADPQAHIDALVEAGVLERQPHYQGNDMYRVAQPHVHEWRVCYVTPALGLTQKGDRKAVAQATLVVTAFCPCGESKTASQDAGSYVMAPE